MNKFLVFGVMMMVGLLLGKNEAQQTNTSSLPICGPPTSLALTFSNAAGQALPLGSPTSALLNAEVNITELLQTNNVVNLTLNSIPLESIAEMGLLLLSVAESTNLNLSTHNADEFSIDVFEAAFNVYQSGITVPLNGSEYGFINASQSIYASNVQFFTNGNTEDGAYLGTVSIMSTSNVTGVECETMLYYLVLFNPPSSVSSMIGDPVLVGIKSQKFQVHGYAGEFLNVWCTDDVILNTRFTFLNANTQDETYTLLQKYNHDSSFVRSHPGTYLDTIGIRTSFDDRILITAGPYNQGFKTVQINGLTIAPDSYVLLSSTPLVIKLDYIDAGNIIIQIYNEFTIHLSNCDNFLNIIKLSTHTTKANGLLGATHSSKTYPDSELKYVPGRIDDYVVSSKDVFGTDFVFNTFQILSNDPSKPVVQYYI